MKHGTNIQKMIYLSIKLEADKKEKTNSGEGWFYSIFDVRFYSLMVSAAREGL